MVAMSVGGLRLAGGVGVCDGRRTVLVCSGGRGG